MVPDLRAVLRALIQGEQWRLSYREVDSDRAELALIGDALSVPGTQLPGT